MKEVYLDQPPQKTDKKYARVALEAMTAAWLRRARGPNVSPETRKA